jgi:TPP-dependent pyruvate/acetoin dehydrogenase alpha subunit
VTAEHMQGMFGDEINGELEGVRERVEREVEDAIKFADESPIPTYEDLFTNIYVD